MSISRLSDLEVEERAASARALLNDPVVHGALEEMKAAYMEALVISAVGSPEASLAHASLKVLQDFKDRLTSMTVENRMRQHLKSGRKYDG